MEIDARGMKDPAPLELLRTALRSQDSLGEEIIILVDTAALVKKVLAFASFTGCISDHEEADGFWRVRIRRMCNCG